MNAILYLFLFNCTFNFRYYQLQFFCDLRSYIANNFGYIEIDFPVAFHFNNERKTLHILHCSLHALNISSCLILAVVVEAQREYRD